MALNVLPNGNIELPNNEVTYIALVTRDAAGTIVPAPSGDVDSVATTGPHAASLGAAVTVMPAGSTNAGAPAISLTPLVVESDAGNSGGSIGLTLTDTAGLPMSTPGYVFDIVVNLSPATVGLDTTDTATVTQAIPTAPGP